jgi:hypothetical protein
MLVYTSMAAGQAVSDADVVDCLPAAFVGDGKVGPAAAILEAIPNAAPALEVWARCDSGRIV